MTLRSFAVVAAGLLMLGIVSAPADAAAAREVAAGCGRLENPFGPFDFRTSPRQVAKVEKYHFGPAQEHLRTTTGIGSNIDYTLRAIPNHHRALVSMMNLGIKEKRPKPFGAEYTVECYMIRAEAFRPDDGMVKLIYGLYHLKAGRAREAVEKLEAAAKVVGDQNANVHYNIGLAYFELREYDKSLESAHRAYALGFPLPGLKKKLIEVKQWQEPSMDANASLPSAKLESPQ